MTEKPGVEVGGGLLDRHTTDLYDALSDLIKVYQFRDRNRVHCHGISVTECYALEALDRHGVLTLNELAARLYLEKSTVSRVVDLLERKALVWRHAHPEDRRAVQIGATEEGKRLHDRIAGEAKTRYRDLVEAIDPDARPVVIEFLQQLAATAKKPPPGGGCGCGEGGG